MAGGLKKKRVWIDTDVAIGMDDPNQGVADVDDAWAMIHLFQAAHIEVAGISTVFGNTDVINATRIARQINQDFNPDQVSVWQGASGPLDLGHIQMDEAVQGMADALSKGPMHIMAIGPGTNIAKLLLLYPELSTQIESLVMVAGRRSVQQAFRVGPLQALPFRDLNFDLDPNAFRILLQFPLHLVLLPFEVSHQCWIGKKELDQLAEMGSVGHYLSQNSRKWLQLWKDFGCVAFNPFDVLASAYLIDHRGFEWEDWSAEIQIHLDDSLEQGQKTKAFKPYLIVGPNTNSSTKVRYCYKPPDQFWQDLRAYLNND